MFVDAYNKASKYTRPVVISHKNLKNECSAAIGSFVVINAEGWAVTAAHIVLEADRLDKMTRLYLDTQEKKKCIYEDTSLDQKTRSKMLKDLPKIEKDAVTNSSVWWGMDGLLTEEIIVIQLVDLAFVKFKNFNPSWVENYPIFKNPSKNISPGKSLCRIGFPFATISPTFNESKDTFILPPGSIPLPLFPNEGIFTRNVNIAFDHNISKPPYELMFIETSSAGLKGQSGGPIFDVNGYIWGIQSQTRHYPLGFSPEVPNGKHGEKEHQFLNIGWGVHIKTLIGAMNDLNIKHEISDN